MALASLVVAILLNAVPLLGLFGLGWSPATILVLYWCESGMGVLFVLARLLLHRAVTRKRGYGRSFTGAPDRPRRGKGPRGSWRFLYTFLGSALLGSAVTAFFYGLMVFAVFGDGRRVSPVDLGKGLLATGSLSLLALFLDARRIGAQPFAWARRIAESSISKFGLLIFALLLGGAAYSFVHRPVVFYGVFVLVKVVADVHEVLQKLGREGGLSTALARFGSWMGVKLGGEATRNIQRARKEQAQEDGQLDRAAEEDERTLDDPESREGKRRKGRKR